MKSTRKLRCRTSVYGTTVIAALMMVTCGAAAADPQLKALKADAYLMCADKMLAEGKTSDAAAIYSQMTDKKNPTMIRVAAYRGLILADQAQALPTVLALLQDENAELQRSARKFALEVPGTNATKAFAASLPSLSPNAQVALLSALASRGDNAAMPEVAKAANSSHEAVRIQAIRALGVLGDASNVESLIKSMAEGGDIGDASMAALSRLGGSGRALVKAVDSERDPATRAKVIEVLESRGEKSAVPTLLNTVKDSDSNVRKASYKALRTLAGEKEFPTLVDMLVSSDDSSERRQLERALTSVIGRVSKVDFGVAPVVAGLAKADADAKVNLLAVLRYAGGSKALKAVRKELKSGNDDVKTAAVRTLGQWSDASPAEDLLTVAKGNSNEARQILAVRGYVRLIGLSNERPAEDTLKMYKAAMEVAHRPDEKKLVLSGVSNVPSRNALEFVEGYLEDRQIKAEAKIAYEKISDLLKTGLRIRRIRTAPRLQNR